MAIYNVTNATELQTALGKAVGGDRIWLAAGDYGNVSITNRNYSSNVIIQALPGTAKAEFDTFKITSSKNISVVGVDIGRALNTGEPEYTVLGGIFKSSNIKFSGVTIHGSYDDNPANDGLGLTIRESSNVNISNSRFEELFRGIAVITGTNITIQNNDIKSMRSDGVVVTATDGIYIDGNRFSDIKPQVPDHSDFIQFWNTGQTRGQSNITIKNNVMLQNYYSGQETTGVQGIFISDPLQYGYKNVLIQNNIIWSNDMYNGITVNGGNGVQILENSILSKSNDSKQLWIRSEGSSNLVIQKNVTDNIILKDVTKLYQADNINFAVTPSARSLVPDLNTPDSLADLLVLGTGYKLPLATPFSPVSAAAANGLSSVLGGASGASVRTAMFPEAGPSTSPAIDLSGLKSALVAAAPLVESQGVHPSSSTVFGAGAEVFVPMYEPMMVSYSSRVFDHFAALP